jgi:hypothetical protein
VLGSAKMNSSPIVREGVLFVVEEGTENATSSEEATGLILLNNVKRVLYALANGGRLSLRESM